MHMIIPVRAAQSVSGLVLVILAGYSKNLSPTANSTDDLAISLLLSYLKTYTDFYTSRPPIWTHPPISQGDHSAHRRRALDPCTHALLPPRA